MIDHATGFIQTVAGDGEPGGDGPLGDGGPATSAHLFMPSDIAVAQNGDLYIADMHHNPIRKVDTSTKLIPDGAGNGGFGQSGDDGPAPEPSLAGPAGIALVEEPRGTVTTIY